MKRLIFTFLSVCCFALVSWSQRTITGVVTDDAGEPLAGATVLVKGTTTGTIADIDGSYSIILPDGSTTLVYSFTGFSTQEYNVETLSTLDVALAFDAIGLEDVVVVGYSPQKRKDVTGSVSSIKSGEIENVQLPSFETALQGRAAGVQVTKNSGKPGGGIDVNIRGRTSISASNQPLYVVDGVPIISGDNLDFAQEGIGGSNVSVLSDLSPNDIESIEVLKDASSAAIYGSRAANGVVLITTKRGSKDGKTSININSSYGNAWLAKSIPAISGQQYQDYSVELWGPLLDAFGLDRSFENIETFLLGPLGNANTRWLDEVFTTSPLTNLSGNISGGNDKTQFYGSFGYSDEEGIMVNSGFTRYNGRLNVNHFASDKLNFSMNMGYSNSNTQQIQNDNNIFGALGASILIPPVVPIFNDDGSYGGAFGIENAVAAVTEYQNNIIRGRLQGKVRAAYNITDELSLSASLGVDLVDQSENIYEPRVLQSSNTGRAVVATISDKRFIHEYVANYNTSFGKSALQVALGTSFQEDDINTTFTEAVDFPTDDFRGLSSGATPLTTNGGFTGDNLRSYFGSVNYNFDSKYYLTATFRADGSTRFVNNQWGFFPGVSAGINLGEILIPESNIDLLKLRLGWGQTGNNVIGNFAALQLYGGGNNYVTPDGADAPGTAPSQIGNPDLKWETTTQINAGIDFGFANSRFGGSIDFYVKNTTDLLLNRPIPTTSGFTSVTQNVGEVQNRGVDITLNASIIDNKDFSWTSTFTVGYLQNEVKKLVDGIPFDVGFANRIAEGQSLGSFFGHVTDGLFQNQAEIDAHATQPNAAPGDFRFMDISGGAGPDGVLGTADDLAPDGVINDNDRTFIGKALPDFQGGFRNVLSYKGITVNAFFQFATGFQVYNNNLAFAEGMNSVFAPTLRAWENRWQQEGDQTNIPRLVRNDPNGNRRDSDRFAEDGDYLRLKTLTVGYNLPSSLLDKIGLQSVEVYASGYNLWTATGYSWFDPEVNIFDGSNTALGTDFLTFPQPRSIIFGVNLGF